MSLSVEVCDHHHCNSVISSLDRENKKSISDNQLNTDNWISPAYQTTGCFILLEPQDVMLFLYNCLQISQHSNPMFVIENLGTPCTGHYCNNTLYWALYLVYWLTLEWVTFNEASRSAAFFLSAAPIMSVWQFSAGVSLMLTTFPLHQQHHQSLITSTGSWCQTTMEHWSCQSRNIYNNVNFQLMWYMYFAGK